MGNPAEETYCYPNKLNLRKPAPFVNKGCAQKNSRPARMTGMRPARRNLLERKLCLGVLATGPIHAFSSSCACDLQLGWC